MFCQVYSNIREILTILTVAFVVIFTLRRVAKYKLIYLIQWWYQSTQNMLRSDQIVRKFRKLAISIWNYSMMCYAIICISSLSMCFLCHCFHFLFEKEKKTRAQLCFGVRSSVLYCECLVFFLCAVRHFVFCASKHLSSTLSGP